ncbi:MAG: sugar phosphate isomerase/epimerase family protein [Pseudomonadota bacterium]
MKFSFSSNGFVRHSIVEAIEKIAQIGYEGIELLADIPHLYAGDLSKSDLEKVKSAIRSSGLHVANINANTAMGYYGRPFWEPLFEPSLANPDENLRNWRVDYTKKCIDLANFFEAPFVSVTSGKPSPGISPAESMSLLADSLDKLIEYSAERLIGIGVEYEPGLLVECFDELSPLLEQIDSPYLGANLDLGHSYVLGEDPKTVIGGLGRRIFHVHIEDITGRKHYHLVPGTGDMDFFELLGLLTENGYNGFVTVELYTFPDRAEEVAGQSLQYLRSVCRESVLDLAK